MNNDINVQTLITFYFPLFWDNLGKLIHLKNTCRLGNILIISISDWIYLEYETISVFIAPVFIDFDTNDYIKL